MEFIETIGKLVVRYHSFFEEGIVNTLIIAAFTVFFGTIFGTLMSSMRMSKILPLKWLAVAYIEFIRGTPLMVQLMFIFYGLPMVGFTLPDISWIPNFSRFSAGIIAMSINSCAYVAEIIRSGVQAVDVGQMEAARSVGFSHGQAMRLVVLPQAIKNILPALGNEFVTVIKESSIVSVIGLADLMFRTNDVIALTYKSLACLAIAALCSKKVSFGSICAALSLPVWALVLELSQPRCALAIVGMCLVVIRHRENIKRLINGTEPDFKPGKSKRARETDRQHN